MRRVPSSRHYLVTTYTSNTVAQVDRSRDSIGWIDQAQHDAVAQTTFTVYIQGG